jgi:hypothetical protein
MDSYEGKGMKEGIMWTSAAELVQVFHRDPFYKDPRNIEEIIFEILDEMSKGLFVAKGLCKYYLDKYEEHIHLVNADTSKIELPDEDPKQVNYLEKKAFYALGTLVISKDSQESLVFLICYSLSLISSDSNYFNSSFLNTKINYENIKKIFLNRNLPFPSLLFKEHRNSTESLKKELDSFGFKYSFDLDTVRRIMAPPSIVDEIPSKESNIIKVSIEENSIILMFKGKEHFLKKKIGLLRIAILISRPGKILEVEELETEVHKVQLFSPNKKNKSADTDDNEEKVFFKKSYVKKLDKKAIRQVMKQIELLEKEIHNYSEANDMEEHIDKKRKLEEYKKYLSDANRTFASQKDFPNDQTVQKSIRRDIDDIRKISKDIALHLETYLHYSGPLKYSYMPDGL